MAELEIPNVNTPPTLPSTTESGVGATLTTNGHGKGYDGLNSSNGHANGNGNGQKQKQVTIAIIGAGQRGQVCSILLTT